MENKVLKSTSGINFKINQHWFGNTALIINTRKLAIPLLLGKTRMSALERGELASK